MIKINIIDIYLEKEKFSFDDNVDINNRSISILIEIDKDFDDSLKKKLIILELRLLI